MSRLDAESDPELSSSADEITLADLQTCPETNPLDHNDEGAMDVDNQNLNGLDDGALDIPLDDDDDDDDDHMDIIENDILGGQGEETRDTIVDSALESPPNSERETFASKRKWVESRAPKNFHAQLGMLDKRRFDPSTYLGQRVESRFRLENGSYKLFQGTVMAYSKMNKNFKVRYDDGDILWKSRGELRLIKRQKHV